MSVPTGGPNVIRRCGRGRPPGFADGINGPTVSKAHLDGKRRSQAASLSDEASAYRQGGDRLPSDLTDPEWERCGFETQATV